jgi:hypothetical protein
VGVLGVGKTAGVEGHGSPGVAGFTQSDGSAGVVGFATGTGTGVRADAIAGPGVHAHSQAGPAVQAASDTAHGVVGQAQAKDAAGVSGTNDHKSGVGVDAYSGAGIALRAHSTSGTAVYAETLDAGAVTANTWSKSEPAISAFSLGPAVNAEGGTIGVNAIGVKTGLSAVSLGVTDPSDNTAGVGVFGTSMVGDGVSGVTLSGVGVRGIGAPQAGAWAGLFEGNVLVAGTLVKFADFFQIDHPLDPDDKVLRHATVESNEYKTFYDGIVSLNERGAARVRLPDWFDALNRDVRYQLTPVGEPAPRLHIAEEARAGEFAISGGQPHQRVCWQVTGVRRDTWAEANPIKVEDSKGDVPAATGTDVIQRLINEARERGEWVRAEATARERDARARRHPAGVPPATSPEPTSAPTMREKAEHVLTALERLLRSR